MTPKRPEQGEGETVKYQLNESSQKRQKAILDALKTGVPLAGLLAVTAIVGGGCDTPEALMGEPPAVSAAPVQPNRVNENQTPVKRGEISIDGDIASPPGEPVAPEKHDK